MLRPRRGFSLMELLLVVGVCVVLFGLLIPVVQKGREAANRTRCQSNLRQLGVALHQYHDVREGFPPGLVSSVSNVCDAEASGFTYLLPYLGQDAVQRLYHFDAPWFHVSNYEAVSTSVKLFYCPSNREQGAIDLGPVAAEWGMPLPPRAASSDYALCKGANGAIHWDWSRTPLPVRGVFQIRTQEEGTAGVRFMDVRDGLSATIAMGDAAGGTPMYLARSLQDPGQPALDAGGQPVFLDQSWGAAGVGESTHPWYGSVFAVAAQYGLGPDPRDEPMNRQPATPTVNGNDALGDNSEGKDHVSGFRSLHPAGCNFLFCDGSVRFLSERVQPAVYRALATYAGGEALAEQDY